MKTYWIKNCVAACGLLKGLSSQVPTSRRIGLKIRMKKSQNHAHKLFYILSPNQPFVAFRGRRYVLADWPYWPNITHTCRTLRMPYHVYVPAGYSCPNELYNIHGDTHAPIKVNVQKEHKPYRSNGDTFDTNPSRILQTTLRTIQYHPYWE